MSTFEEIRRTGLKESRVSLDNSPYREGLVAAFERWWCDGDRPNGDDSDRQISHPSAEQLADALRLAGMEEAADFATGRWIKQDPIARGTWLFAILLGESFAAPFTAALIGGRWRAPRFYGLETFGAWESFYLALRERLRIAVDAREAALSWLNHSAEQTIKDPLALVNQNSDRGNLRDRIKRYGASPDIEEAWVQPFDPPFLLKDAFLWTALLEVCPAETLALVGSLPHPAFMRNCLGGKWLAERDEEVGPLIAAAPEAFDGSGNFQGAGAVALQLLEIATDAVEHVKRESEEDIQAPIDKRELLEPVVKRCELKIKILLEHLFSRQDAVFLAWTWLERVVSHGKNPSPPQKGGSLAVHLSELFIEGVAQRLHRREDWKEWVQEQKALWRVHRLTSVLAVGALCELPDTDLLAQVLEWALIESDLDCNGLDRAIGNEANILASIGGRAIATLPDPVTWFENTWQDLRPVRERNWRSGTGGGKHNSMGELLIVWGLSSRGLLPAPRQKAMWTCLERSVRDAWQTDTFGYAPIWSRALVLLFETFEPDQGDSSAIVAQQFADAFLPYIASDRGFLLLVISLTQRRWPLEIMRNAVALAGFDLARLAQHYLEMKDLVFALPQAVAQEIERFRELAEAVSTAPGDRGESGVT